MRLPQFIDVSGDARLGGLIGAVIAADLTSESGQHRSFAQWLIQSVESRYFSAEGGPSRDVGDAPEDLRDLARDVRRLVYEPSEDGGGGVYTAGDPELELTLRVPPVVALRGRSGAEIISLGMMAGASGLPSDWLGFGSLREPEVFGRLMSGSSATMMSKGVAELETASRVLKAAPDSCAEHESGIMFASPLHVLDPPSHVRCIVSIGVIPRVVIPASVRTVTYLPWLADGAASALAGVRCSWHQFHEQRKELSTACGNITLFERLLEASALRPPRRLRNALTAAADHIERMHMLWGPVMVVGDWSEAHLGSLWNLLSGGTFTTTHGAQMPQDLYRWEVRASQWSHHTRPQWMQEGRTHRVGTPEGAEFYGVSIGETVTWEQRHHALARENAPATLEQILDVQQTFMEAKRRQDLPEQQRAQAEFKRLQRIVVDVEQLTASELLDILDRDAEHQRAIDISDREIIDASFFDR